MLVALGAPAHAGVIPVVWDFTQPLGNLGVSHTYNSTPSGGGSMIATAFGPGNPDLFAKNDGPGERGLGLTNSAFGDNEINPSSFVQLDLSGTAGSVLNAKFSFEGSSIQDGENAQLWGSNTNGVLGT